MKAFLLVSLLESQISLPPRESRSWYWSTYGINNKRYTGELNGLKESCL